MPQENQPKLTEIPFQQKLMPNPGQVKRLDLRDRQGGDRTHNPQHRRWAIRVWLQSPPHARDCSLFSVHPVFRAPPALGRYSGLSFRFI
jgi:hypothetical protein